MREEKRRETREDLLPKIAKEVEQDGTLGATENSFQRKNRWSALQIKYEEVHLSTCWSPLTYVHLDLPPNFNTFILSPWTKCLNDPSVGRHYVCKTMFHKIIWYCLPGASQHRHLQTHISVIKAMRTQEEGPLPNPGGEELRKIPVGRTFQLRHKEEQRWTTGRKDEGEEWREFP